MQGLEGQGRPVIWVLPREEVGFPARLSSACGPAAQARSPCIPADGTSSVAPSPTSVYRVLACGALHVHDLIFATPHESSWATGLPVSPLTKCVTLGKPVCLLVPQCAPLNDGLLPELLRVNSWMDCLELYLTSGQGSRRVSSSCASP